MTHVVACFCNAPPRPPTSWVPPGRVPRSPNPLWSDDEPPTSLWRGEGQAGILAGDAGDCACIPQERGGVNGGV